VVRLAKEVSEAQETVALRGQVAELQARLCALEQVATAGSGR
jgi:hypothetical protein